MKVIFSLCAFSFLSTACLHAQGILFAELNGSPVNTANWNLVGDARPGDTNGDANSNNDEIILCDNKFNTSGACFYQQPINLLVCNKWYAEFDYRMYDGNSADGIAFCFLVNPPTGFIAGGGIGIPSKPKGLMIVFDSYNNCNTTGSSCCTPKLEIRYGDGISNYNECPDPAQPTLSDVKEIRSPQYNHALINYDNGKIEVYVNGVFKLSGNYPINYDGYLGFTASTGASRDLHSIKNVKIYTLSGATDAGPDTAICSGETVQLGKPAKPGYTYSWTPATGLSDATASDPLVTPTNTGNSALDVYYTLTADSSGIKCNANDVVKITVYPNAVAKAGKDMYLCLGDSIELFAEGGNTYLWSPQSSLDDRTKFNPVAFPAVSTIYRVIVSHGALKCSDTAYMGITIRPKPLVVAGRDTTLCKGDSTQLFVNSDAVKTIKWFPAAGLNASHVPQPWAKPLSTITYFGTVTDTSGCSSSDSVIVKIIEPPAISGTVTDSMVCEGKQFELDAQNPGFKYTWSTGSSLRRIKLSDSGSYYVKIYNECFEDTSRFHISYLDCSGRLYMPSAFTPNNDGLNDLFTYSGQNVTALKFTIYNRWGQKVFESDQVNAKWDGTYNDRECPMDVYFYMIAAEFLDDTYINLKGVVTLLK
jgi:gliding motility-associated-like protein